MDWEKEKKIQFIENLILRKLGVLLFTKFNSTSRSIFSKQILNALTILMYQCIN